MAPETEQHDGEPNQNTVFIDTSLDTHLATIVSDSDTVSDLKKKVMLEHLQCFPAIGDIKIHCLKVKRRGKFYHLSDSMLVKSAFGDTKRNWFVSVDASRLEQDDGIQQYDKRKVGDQLALPWVTDSRSIDRHDSLADRPSKVSLVNGSPSMHPKIVPFVSQKVPSVDQFTSGDSCKDASENIEEHRSSNDDHWRNPQPDSEKQLDSKIEKLNTSNKEIKSKKRMRDVHDENSLENALRSGASVKKKRRTQRIDANVKASEENGAIIHDTDRVKYKGTGIPDENSFEHISNGKDATSDGLVTKALSDEHARTMLVSPKNINIIDKGENHSALDQAATVVPSSVEDVGVETHPPKKSVASETVPDVAMIVEENIQEEMPFGISLKEKDNELVQKAVTGIETPSSLMRTADCERDAPVVIAEGHLKGAKHSIKHKAAEKKVSSTPFTRKSQKIHKDAIASSQQDVGSTGQEFAGDRIDKGKEDREVSLNQGPEVKLPERSKETKAYENTGGGKKRKVKKSAAKNKDELVVKHVDIHVGDISSSVPAPVFDDKVIDEGEIDKFSLGSAERNEVSEKTLIDDPLVSASKKGDDPIVKEVEISEPTESHRRQLHVDDMEEKQKKELEDCVGSRRKKKVARRSVSINDESVAKHAGDATTGTNEENLLPRSERKESLETTLVDALYVDVGRSDDNPMNNAVEISITDKNRNQVNAEDINDNSKKENEKMDGTKKSKRKKKTKTSAARNEDESVTKHGNVVGMSTAVSDPALDGHLHETSLPGADRKDNPEEKLADASQVAVGTDGDKVKGKDAESFPVNEANISKDGLDGKSRNKQNSTSQTLSSVPIEEQLNKLDKAQDAQGFDEGLVRKAKKNHKSSVKGRKDLQNKHQSTELELEPEKSKDIPEETLKNVAVTEVSKVRMEGRDDVNNEVDIPKERSQEIDFMNYFVPGHQPNKIVSIDNVKDATRSGREKKPKKKTKGLLPLVETSADLGKSQVSFGNKQNREQDDSRNDSTIQSQKSLTKNEHNKLLLSSKKTSEVSINVVKDPNITHIDQIKTPKKTKLIDPPKTSNSAHANKGQDGPSSESSSSSETFGRPFRNKMSNKQQPIQGKTLVKTLKKSAPVMNNSRQDLLSTIFGDGSDGSSADDNATVNSDSSTRTPSGKSSSSSGESASSIDSRRNGSHAMKRKESGGKNSMNSQSRLKNISMADLLRSSSRFKKAKMNASQVVEDTESEPVDFVPDSQPIAMR
ncbi:hypothetical protein L6452_12858 [Arctium lappa]|uniref:Uncharacterized protein n=1 Tax=Arctium lappa TaxID=4217 RepID=A0ACB9CGV9_ARCLA|nr:hypothetical protein L6452_12858 [Arctium lappa]